MGLLERLVIVGGLLLPQAGCVDTNGGTTLSSHQAAAPRHRSTAGSHRHRRTSSSTKPAKPNPIEDLDTQVKEALAKFVRLPEAEQQRHYVNIELLVRRETSYGGEFDFVYEQALDRGIITINRHKKESGGTSYLRTSQTFGPFVVMEMHEPAYSESVAGLLLAGKVAEHSNRVGENWLTIKYHELLHVLALDQLEESEGRAQLRAAHQTTRHDLDFHKYLKLRRGFRVTKRHRQAPVYARYKSTLPLEQRNHENADRLMLEMYGLSTALETVAYHRADNINTEEITAHLRKSRKTYPDALIGGINLQQVRHLVRAIDRLYALDLDDYGVAGVLARTGWSYETGSKQYTALEDAVQARMEEVGRFAAETDARAFAAQQRRTRDLAKVRSVVEKYLLDTFQ